MEHQQRAGYRATVSGSERAGPGSFKQARWKAGNAIAFMITGNGRRTAWSYERSPIHAPKLVVSWESSTVVTSYEWPPYAAFPVSAHENQIRVFPNPVTNLLVIQKQGAPNDAYYEYVFYDISGEKAMQGSSRFDETGTSELNLAKLPAGLYVTSITTVNEKRSIKIIKQ